MAQRIHLNTSLDIMIMMLLDHYMQDVHKYLTSHAKKFDENATMSFRANSKQLLKNYNKIWEKVQKLMRIDFESKPVKNI